VNWKEDVTKGKLQISDHPGRRPCLIRRKSRRFVCAKKRKSPEGGTVGGKGGEVRGRALIQSLTEKKTRGFEGK